MLLLAWLEENRRDILRMLLLRMLVALLIASVTYIFTRNDLTDTVWEQIGVGIAILIIIAALTFDAAAQHTIKQAKD
jgi:energy-converting hydrogenase Eha subunit G